MRKIPFAGVELTSQRVRGLRGTSELPGRPAVGYMLMITAVLFIVLYVKGVTILVCGRMEHARETCNITVEGGGGG